METEDDVEYAWEPATEQALLNLHWGTLLDEPLNRRHRESARKVRRSLGSFRFPQAHLSQRFRCSLQHDCGREG